MDAREITVTYSGASLSNATNPYDEVAVTGRFTSHQRAHAFVVWCCAGSPVKDCWFEDDGRLSLQTGRSIGILTLTGCSWTDLFSPIAAAGSLECDAVGAYLIQRAHRRAQ